MNNEINCGTYTKLNSNVFTTKSAFRKGGRAIFFDHYDGTELPAMASVFFPAEGLPIFKVGTKEYALDGKLNASYGHGGGLTGSFSIRRMVIAACEQFHILRLSGKGSRKSIFAQARNEAQELSEALV